MSRSDTTLRSLQQELESLVANLMGDARPDKVNGAVDRLEATLDAEAGADEAEIAPAAVAEVRSAIELLHGGQSCAAVSALLAARSALGTR
ncbi:MAG: hypothetical protein ACRDRM_07545 [Pseudonocardiaceae bacterium]